MRSKILGIWLAVMAGLQFFSSAADLSNLVPSNTLSWIQLSVGALQAASAFYVINVATTPADQARWRKATKSRGDKPPVTSKNTERV